MVDGSIRREADGTVRFAVTDTAQQVEVVYHGILPDLFRDGQGVVAQGALRADGVFEAAEVLAKHDENYMPKEVADALKQAGYWKDSEAGGESAMIAEIGHYALVLALGLALVQGTLPLVGAARRDADADRRRRARRLRPVPVRDAGLRRADPRLRHLRLLDP